MAIEIRLLEFPSGHLQPSFDRFGRLSSPTCQPLVELLRTRRLHEDGDRLCIVLQYRECTLHIDLQHHPAACCQPGSDLIDERAIPGVAAIHPATLEKLTILATTGELIRKEKVVVDPFSLAGPRRPRGSRHAWDQLRQPLQQHPQNRGLAHA